MKRSAWLRALTVAALAALAASCAWAHHSIASEFDLFKAHDISGVLTKVEWINPHGYLYMDVKNQDGSITKWSLETPPPSGWRRAGVATRDLFPIGQNYSARIAPAKNGTNTGLVIEITLPDGRKVGVLAAQAPGSENN
jgi:hypothetical protein